MKFIRKALPSIAAMLLAAGGTGGVCAAVSADEAAQLGQSLTPWGAEMAGNKDASIPAYTGGLTQAPAGFKPGSGVYPDPFKDEKPLYTITKANLAQYADKLADGQKALFQKYPDYRMHVYPTHRTVAMPKRIADETIKNAVRASTTDGGVGIKGAEIGYPFPIPKNGHEVIWNHALVYQGAGVDVRTKSFYVDQGGRNVLTADAIFHTEYPYHQPDHPQRQKLMGLVMSDAKAPASVAGGALMIIDSLDQVNEGRRAYQYVPGQRRVKLAPEFAYDTPNPSSAGLVTFDDSRVFFGKLDRYAFKLLGKRDMFIPYSQYRMMNASMEEVGTAKFINPDLMRWELHRVWVVEATLLPGKRHIYSKRIFYWDEDSFMGMSDQYDQSGKLLRHGLSLTAQLYDRDLLMAGPTVHYDFSANTYVVSAMPLQGDTVKPVVKPWAPAQWSPEGMAARALR